MCRCTVLKYAVHGLLRRILVPTVTRHWPGATARNQTVPARSADPPRSPLTCAPAESGSILISAATHPRTQSTMVACTVTRPLTHQPAHTRTHTGARRPGSARLGWARSAEPARGSLALNYGAAPAPANMAQPDAEQRPSRHTQLTASYVGASRSPPEPVGPKGAGHDGCFPAGV